MSARYFIVFAVVAGTLTVVACSSDPAAAPPTPPTIIEAGAATEAGPSYEAGVTGPWTAGTCGTCAVAQCKSRRDACDGEPSCAAHARCVDACAAGPTGTPDEACVNACPRGEGTAASKLRAAYDTCVRSPGDACPACTVAPPSTVDVLSQTCGGSTETNECFKCEDLSCCQTYKECVDEPECKQGLQPCLVACAGKPDYDACKAGCYDAHPKGVAAWARRQTCVLARCGVACNDAKPLDPCVECTTVTKCRDATARCTADHDCFLLNECVTNCQVVDDTCISACKSKFPDAAGVLFDAFTTCAFTSCLDVCG